jgi:hypothetical protein
VPPVHERRGPIAPLLPECFDLKDNDRDTTTDWLNDPGCSSPSDTSERGNDVCDDGLDNDGEGRTDYPADPGCTPTDTSEADPQPQPRRFYGYP